MRPAADGIEVFVCVEPMDLRKQIDGLSAIVQEELALDPFGGQLFVFAGVTRSGSSREIVCLARHLAIIRICSACPQHRDPVGVNSWRGRTP